MAAVEKAPEEGPKEAQVRKIAASIEIRMVTGVEHGGITTVHVMHDPTKSSQRNKLKS